MTDGYDPDGRGLPQAVPGSVDDQDKTTKLAGGKQLGKAIYGAIAADPHNPNCKKVIASGYRVQRKTKTTTTTKNKKTKKNLNNYWIQGLHASKPPSR